MLINKTLPLTAAVTLLASPLFAGSHASGLRGATVAITNTFQGAQTDGVETDVAAFGMNNNRFAVVGDDVEFPDFITLYSVEITADSIGFRWGDSEMAQTLSGPTPDGNHDRNYFLFDLKEGQAITDVSFDADASDLIDGSAEPTATVIGPNKLVTDFSSGVIRGAGFNPVYTVTVGESQ